MAIYKCKMCGGELTVEDGASVAVCEYCGTKQTVPKTNSEVITNLFNRANNLRLKCEFDKAASVYEKIVQEDDSEAEAHWGLVLCKYGIEYVTDPATGEKVPTCHRTLYEPITKDVDYQTAIDYSDSLQQSLYEQEARKIDRIQKDILVIVKEEKPFDVFLCYKETDENGKRTQDSVIANDIYYQLTQEGYKVFYAAITLEDKLGQEYEPYIFAALNSAKVMLVIGTKPEYFNAVWVKNEWSRFMNFMKTDRTKLLIPCYRDMDAYDLPEEFSHLQAQDMGKIGFINDVVRGIKKVISKETEQAKAKETVVVQQSAGGTNVQAQIKRGNMALGDHDWEKADGFFEEALNLDPENAEAYLGKLLARDKKPDFNAWIEMQQGKYAEAKTERLEACAADDAHTKELAQEWMQPGYLEESTIQNLYQFDFGFGSSLSCREQQKERQLNELSADKLLAHAKQYATGDFGKQLEQGLASITDILNKRIAEAQKADDERVDGIKKAYAEHIAQADRKVEELGEDARKRRENDYQAAVSAANSAKDIHAFEKAISELRAVNGYKDSAEQIERCEKSIHDLLDEKLRKEDQEFHKKKRNIILAVVAVVVCIVAIFIVIKVIIPNNKYNAAVELMNNGQYEEAITAFEAMDGYKDSNEQIENCQTALKDIDYNAAVALMNNGQYEEAIIAFEAMDGYKDSKERIAEIGLSFLDGADVGSKVYLGMYEQDNNTENGKEKIEWTVLAKEGDKLLLISKYALEVRPYNTECRATTWEKCTLRTWLNTEFYTAAFSAEEQKLIAETTVTADMNPEYGTDPGNPTKDKVFLLSIPEANQYFANDEARRCAPKAEGAVMTIKYKTASGETACWWWLRSPGDGGSSAAIVSNDGLVCDWGFYVNFDHYGVRPALWIDLKS